MRWGLLATGLAMVAVAWATPGAEGSFPGADGMIAFERTTDHGLQSSIYLIAADGSGLERLTPSRNGVDVQPAFSSDGSRIAFVRDGEVWVMRADGAAPRRLTDPPRYVVDAQPTWSPDGKRLVFVRSSRSAADTADLWAVDADGADLHRVAATRNLDERWPAWSPDGRRIAFTNVEIDTGPRPKPPGIYTVAADGSDLDAVAAGRQQPFDSDWSPDGRRIVFVRANGGRAQLLVADAHGGGVHRLVRTIRTAASPVYSPSGESIAFSVGGTLSVVAANGGEPRALLERPNNGRDFGASWQPLPSP